jgi:hypothetical protein
MNAADVIGYVKDGTILCAECGEHEGWDKDSGDEVGAVFPGSETDSPCRCEECEALIPQALTSDGVRYVHEAFRRFLRSHGTSGRPEILIEWATEFDYVPGARFFLSRVSKYEKVG